MRDQHPFHKKQSMTYRFRRRREKREMFDWIGEQQDQITVHFQIVKLLMSNELISKGPTDEAVKSAVKKCFPRIVLNMWLWGKIPTTMMNSLIGTIRGELGHGALSGESAAKTTLLEMIKLILLMFHGGNITEQIFLALRLADVPREIGIVISTKMLRLRVTEIPRNDLDCCDHCGGTSRQFKLRLCSRCQKVSYCGVHCQSLGWENHSKVCSSAQKK